jgi:hypothetical protein
MVLKGTWATDSPLTADPSQDGCVCTAVNNKNVNKNMLAEKDNSIRELRCRLDNSIPGGYNAFFSSPNQLW